MATIEQAEPLIEYVLGKILSTRSTGAAISYLDKQSWQITYRKSIKTGKQ